MPVSLPRPDHRSLSPVARISIVIGRLDRRRVIATALLVFLGLVAVRTTIAGRAAVTGLGSTFPVAVAERDLPAGTVLAPGDIRWEQWPRSLAPDGPDISALGGATVRSAISAGEPLLESRIIDDTNTLRPDERAIAIPLPLAPPPLAAGQIIEMIGLTPGLTLGDQVLVERQSLGPGRVVAVDDVAITLAVPRAAVGRIIEIVATGSVEVVITPFRS